MSIALLQKIFTGKNGDEVNTFLLTKHKYTEIFPKILFIHINYNFNCEFKSNAVTIDTRVR